MGKIEGLESSKPNSDPNSAACTHVTLSRFPSLSERPFTHLQNEKINISKQGSIGAKLF